MMRRYLTVARLRREATAQAMIRALSPADPDRAMDTHHQLVWSLFASDARKDAERDFLWRVDQDRFMILSDEVPKDSHSLFDLEVRRFQPAIGANDRFVFRLRANATICRTENIQGKRRRHRHDVVMDKIRRLQVDNAALERAEARELAIPQAAREWLDRTGEKAGYSLEALGTTSYRTVDLGRKRGKSARFGVLDIEGTLVVREPDLLISRICRGFGRAKAFGCGLLLLKT